MYVSNHYIWWYQGFERENETRFGVYLDVPHLNAHIGLNQSILTNRIYYGSDFLPRQSNDLVSVTGIYWQQNFRVGILHLNNRALMQWSTNQEVIPVPALSVYLSYFLEFNVVRDVLRMQLGLDGRYNTKYNAFGYNPAIGQFYNQNVQELGDYPVVDAFVSAKWKRVRIRLKYTHLNENMLANRNSFMILNHPLNRPVFKIGLSWGFYD
jgi:hypothetical protein